MNETISVAGITIILLVLIGVVGYMILATPTTDPLEYDTSQPIAIHPSEPSAQPGIYFCCNLEGVWKDTPCWAHHSSWCSSRGDDPDGKNCEEMCIDEGYDGGNMEGHHEGLTEDRVYCACFKN